MSETQYNIPSVSLDKLEPRAQWIDCPKCNRRTQTVVQGRSERKQNMMSLMFWPLPNCKHWWEQTHWFCKECNTELAKQKYGKEMEVLAA